MSSYYIIPICYNKIRVPILLDIIDAEFILNLNKEWKCTEDGDIYCECKQKIVKMHDIIMSKKNNENNKLNEKLKIIHLNKIGLDNRRENLEYKREKKKRTLEICENGKKLLLDLPDNICYMKPDSTHGERFMVEINGKIWKTTSSKKVSLKYKLEEAKKYLLENDLLKKKAIQLLNSFYDIIYLFGYDDIEKLPYDYVKLSKEEKLLLNNFEIKKNKRRRLINNIPNFISSNNLPIYCYYVPATIKHGDYFMIDKKLCGNKIWYSSSTRKKNINEKYNELMKKYNELTNNN